MLNYRTGIDVQMQMLLKYVEITIELHIILNLLPQQLVSDIICSWKTSILR
jgi:hypothetical protein